MVDIIEILGLFVATMYLSYKIEAIEDRCKRLERKNNLMELKFIDRKDLRLELDYRKSIEDFRKVCDDFNKRNENLKRLSDGTL